MTYVESRQRSAVARAEKDEMELARMRGELLRRTDAEQAWSDLLIAFARELDAFPLKAGMAVAATCGLGPKHRPAIKEAIGLVLAGVRQRLADDPLGRSAPASPKGRAAPAAGEP